MKARLLRHELHGEDIVGVAGGVVDQEHDAGTVEVAQQQQQFTGREQCYKVNRCLARYSPCATTTN